MKRNITSLASLVFTVCLTLTACDQATESIPKPLGEIPSNGIMRLGEKLVIPFTIENVRKAYKKLKSENRLVQKGQVEINATHLYIRLNPKTEKQLETILADSNQTIFDYPLDYYIIWKIYCS